MKRNGLIILLLIFKASLIASAQNNYYSHFKTGFIKQFKFFVRNLINNIVLFNYKFIKIFLLVLETNLLQHNIIQEKLNIRLMKLCPDIRIY